jgi:hypothetical protein
LAKQLHAESPETPFRFFTDDKQFQKFMKWDLHYVSGAYPYPKEWTEKHYIAMLNRMGINRFEAKWQLLAMNSGLQKFKPMDVVIADLD